MNWQRFIFILCLTVATGCAPKKQSGSAIPAQDLQRICVNRLTQVIVYDIFTPPVAARIYAYTNLSWYEAIRHLAHAPSITEGLRDFTPMPSPQKNEQYNFYVAALTAFFTTAKKFTFSKDSLRLTEENLLGTFQRSVDETVYKNSIAFGIAVSEAVLQRAAADNYTQSRSKPKYSVFRGKHQWEQTPPDYADAVEPWWHTIKPLLLDSASQCAAPPPPAYNLDKNSHYYKELLEVYRTSKSLTPQQDSIAGYWDDNPFVTTHTGHLTYATKKTTPPGHWMGIVGILSAQQKLLPVQTARLYALTSAAMFDSFISCWYNKYTTLMMRPITVLRQQLDPVWSSRLQTPPFPEYTSGHSVITAAAATVLTHYLGHAVAFTDTTELQYLGMQRTYSSVWEAANEAAISRLYGGIHFRSAIEQGQAQGRRIGERYVQEFSTAHQ